MVDKEIIKIVNAFIKEVEKRGIKIYSVYIYGSYARGNYRKDSDIDVAVILQDFGKDSFEKNVLLRKIAWRVDTRIEPVALSIDDFMDGDWIPLVGEIKKGQKVA
jgi:predicted nucleotidyltransferase